MGLLQGGLSVARYLVLGPVPDEREILDGLTQYRFRPFEDGLEEERVGWCDWRRLKIVPPDPLYIMNDQDAVFSLRIDSRRIPSDLLKAEVDERVEQLVKEKNLQFLGKEAHLSVLDEVKAELMKKVLPSPKAYEVVWELKGGTLFTTATSTKAQSALVEIFMKSFGCELQLQGPLALAARVAPEVGVERLLALDPLDLELEPEDAMHEEAR